MTYPESHSRAPSRSHFRAVPWSHSKRLRAGHAELTAVWPLCALTPAASHLGTVGLLRVQAQTPSQGSQPPGCAAMFLTRPGVSQGLTVSLKAGAQNGAGPRRGSSSSPAAGSSHGARHTSLVTSLAKHLWIVRAQDGAFGLDSRKRDRCSLLNSPRRCVSVGEGTGQTRRPAGQGRRSRGEGAAAPSWSRARPGCCDEHLGQRASLSWSRSLGVQRPERTRLLVHARPAFCRLRTWRKVTGSSLGPLS